MLRYDSVDIKTYVYHAYALLITADEGSDYSSPPSMSLRYNTSPQNGAPAPADGNGVSAAAAAGDHQAEAGPSSRTLRASKLHQYHGPDGSYTFWRFKIEVPMRSFQVSVTYSIDAAAGPKSDSPTALDAPEWTFYVPSRTQNFRWAGHSCNGFSASIDESEWNGANPLWDDLMKHHAQSPFHAVVGGGDQIYCDKLTQEPEMQPWVHASDPKTRMAMELTPEIRTCIDRYYFHHYCEVSEILSIPLVAMRGRF